MDFFSSHRYYINCGKQAQGWVEKSNITVFQMACINIL